jgi:hypothetical protein
MQFSSLPRVIPCAALLALACAHQVDEWESDERPALTGSIVSSDAGAGGSGGSTVGGGTSSISGASSGGKGGSPSSGTTDTGGGSGTSGTAPTTSAGTSGSGGAGSGEGGSAGDVTQAGAAGGGGSPESSGGASSADDCASLPEWEKGTDYDAGDRVSNGYNVYQCRPAPESGWCGAADAYAPGSGWAWADAWILVGPC